MSFGKHTDALFDGSGPVTFGQLCIAYATDVAQSAPSEAKGEVSELEKAWHKKIQDKYKLDKLTHEDKPRTLDSLDSKPVTPSVHDVDPHTKWDMPNGMEYKAVCHNGGGFHVVETDFEKRDNGRIMKAYGTYKGSQLAFEYTLS